MPNISKNGIVIYSALVWLKIPFCSSFGAHASISNETSAACDIGTQKKIPEEILHILAGLRRVENRIPCNHSVSIGGRRRRKSAQFRRIGATVYEACDPEDFPNILLHF